MRINWLPSAIFAGRFNLLGGANGAQGQVEEGKYESRLITDRQMIAARLLSMIDYQQTAERNGGPSRVSSLDWLFAARQTSDATAGRVAKLRPPDRC